MYLLPVLLGALFYVYIGMLAVFCTNSINIYAGINGLEVGQAIIIALSVLGVNVLQLYVVCRRRLSCTRHPSCECRVLRNKGTATKAPAATTWTLICSRHLCWYARGCVVAMSEHRRG